MTAGTLVVERSHEDEQAGDDLVFDPTSVPLGIELSDDPILRLCSEAYEESHRRRSSDERPAILRE